MGSLRPDGLVAYRTSRVATVSQLPLSTAGPCKWWCGDSLKALSVQAYIDDIVIVCGLICALTGVTYSTLPYTLRQAGRTSLFSWMDRFTRWLVIAFWLCILIEPGSTWLRRCSRPTSLLSPLRATGHPMWQNFCGRSTGMGFPQFWGALQMYPFSDLPVFRFSCPSLWRTEF